MKIYTSKFLEKEPALLGFTQAQFMIFILTAGVLGLIIPNGKVTLALLVIELIVMRIVSGNVSGDDFIRLLNQCFSGVFKQEAPEMIALEVQNTFDGGFFDRQNAFLESTRSALLRLPEGVSFSIQFQRFKSDISYKSAEGPFAHLAQERRQYFLSKGPFFQNRVFVICESTHKSTIEEVLSSARIQLKDAELPFRLEGHVVDGGRLYSQTHTTTSYKLEVLPEKFEMADLWELLTRIDECVFTISITKENLERKIKKISFKRARTDGFGVGEASRIEGDLAGSTIEKTLEELISGRDAIYGVGVILSTVSPGHEKLELPVNPLSSSFSELSHAGIDDLKYLHGGGRTRWINKSVTGLEVAAMCGIHFASKKLPETFPNFHTSTNEVEFISGLRTGSLPSGNAMVFAPSGKGKSMLLANQFSSVLEETNLNVMILDSGYGFEFFTRAYGGEIIEMTTDSKPKGFNVMKLFKSFENHSFRAEQLAEFTRFIADPRGEIKHNEVSQLRQFASTANFDGTLTEFKNHLKNSGMDAIAANLEPFCKGGIYGAHFDAEHSESLIDTRVLYFTAPAVTSSADNPLLIPYFFIVNLIVSYRATMKKSGTPTLVLWDEIAYLMRFAPQVVSSMWNCIRKTGSSVICCGQHPDQILQYSCGEDIITNSPTRYLLGGNLSSGPLDRIIELTDDDKEYLRDRRPGDLFVLSRESSKELLNFHQSPVHYALFTTDKGERLKMQELYEKEEGSDSMIKAFNSAKKYVALKSKKIALAVVLACSFVGGAPTASAVGASTDAPLLIQILAQTLEQVALLQKTLDTAKNQANYWKNVYSNTNGLLGNIKKNYTILKQKMRNIDDVEDKLRSLEDIIKIAETIKKRAGEVSGVVVGEAKTASDTLKLSQNLSEKIVEFKAFAETVAGQPLNGSGILELTQGMYNNQAAHLQMTATQTEIMNQQLKIQGQEFMQKLGQKAARERTMRILQGMYTKQGAAVRPY